MIRPPAFEGSIVASPSEAVPWRSCPAKEILGLRHGSDADDQPLNRILARPDEADRRPTARLPRSRLGGGRRLEQPPPKPLRLLQVGRADQDFLEGVDAEGAASRGGQLLLQSLPSLLDV